MKDHNGRGTIYVKTRGMEEWDGLYMIRERIAPYERCIERSRPVGPVAAHEAEH